MKPDVDVKKLLRENPQLQERLSRMPPLAPKPKPTVTAVVSPKLAKAAEANPTSVRIAARAEDGTTVIERPAQFERLEVLEVDALGRPLRVRCYDAKTNSHGMLEYKAGYRQPNEAVSNYDPMDALKRD